MKQRVTLTLDKDVLKKIDSLVDGVFLTNRSQAIESILRSNLKGKVPKKALLLASGSKETMDFQGNHRALIEINGKSLLEHNLDYLKNHGVEEIVVGLGYQKNELKKILSNYSEVTILEEDENFPSGSAGILKKAAKLLGDTFLVTNATDLKQINLEKMYSEHKKNNSTLTIALTTVKDPERYGVAMLDGQKIIRFIQKPSSVDFVGNLINAGLYVVEKEAVELIPEGFSTLEQDLFPKLTRMNSLHGYAFPGTWINPKCDEEVEIAKKIWK